MIRSIIAVLVLGVFAAVSAFAADAFKEDFEGDISGWKTAEYHEKASKVTFEVVSPGKDSGKAYKLSGAEGDIVWEIKSPVFSVEPNAAYELKFDAQHNYNMTKLNVGKDTFSCHINWFDADGNKISETGIAGFDAPNTDWHVDKAANLQSPANAAKAQIQLGANYPHFNTGQYIVFDNMTFNKAR